MQRLRARLSELDRRRRHRASARALLRLGAEPESWLDIATGDAHFPAAAKELFPYTSFDGLDATGRVEAARGADRVEEAHVGAPTDPHITRALTGRYDVISLLGPTEHLGAALAFLRPGGHVLVETASPDAVRAELAAHACAIVPTDRHPALDRLSRTTRIIARRAPSPA
ncbi:methyltransferase domain-containing protein [Streptomyces sp. NPDC090106]|uniref:methyltransferase domain-containing protein n=1 Tax=Streptomyces sp. NPDC090106 TaxID=3365946 RepID=UPI00381DE695